MSQNKKYKINHFKYSFIKSIITFYSIIKPKKYKQIKI